METRLCHTTLPTEILLEIVDRVVPKTKYCCIAFVPSHPITKTLLALTCTSRAIYPTARRLLFSHCLYIHTEQRLHKLLRALVNPSQSPEPSHSIEGLLPYVTSLYLRPYGCSSDLRTDSSTIVASAIENLFSIIGPYLRRLLLDIPLRSLYPQDDDHKVRPILRKAFSKLSVLEEFCSVRDELYLDIHEPPSDEPYLWSLWPKLRSLALYNVDVSSPKFWSGLRTLESIETLALTRADGYDEVDMEREWEKLCDDGLGEKSVNVVLLNVEAEHRALRERDHLKDMKMRISQLNIPISYYGDENVIELCQQWVKRRVLQGQPVSEWD